MSWNLHVAKRAQKELSRIPPKDQSRILAALRQMSENPFIGDIAPLKGQLTGWRRRVGNYRIFFDVHPENSLVEVTDIARRSSTTY
jgi:mRNA-degrading endonuclease RelE of RelBE toxin-antitoxin system